MKTFLLRVLVAYIGALGLPLLLFPLATKFTMGGHSLMFLAVFSPPISLTAALTIFDVRRNCVFDSIAKHAAFIFGVYGLTFILFAFITGAINNGWMINVLIVPLLTAIITSKVNSRKAQIESMPSSIDSSRKQL